MQVNQNSQLPEQLITIQHNSEESLSLNQLLSELKNNQTSLHSQQSSPQTKQNNSSDEQNEQYELENNMRSEGDEQKIDEKETLGKEIIEDLKEFYHIANTEQKQGLDHSNEQQHETNSNAIELVEQKDEGSEKCEQYNIKNGNEIQEKEKTSQFESKEKENDKIEYESKCEEEDGRELGYFEIYDPKANKKSIVKTEKPANKSFSIPEPIPEQINPIPKVSAKNQSDGKWLEYLKSVYSHYCKSTYATGKFPTFDRILESTSCLNINTFVHFCRDFEIDINRIKLIEIFKKANHFQKEMNFDQFVEAFHFLSKEKMNKQTSSESLDDDRFEEFLKAIHLNSSANFHNRMVLLSMKARKHGINANESLSKPKKESPYKFNILPSNGRNPEDISQQLELIKFEKQDNRIRLQKIRHERIKKEEHEFELATKMPIRTKIIKTGGYMSPLRPLKLTVQTPSSHQKLTSSNIGYPKTSLSSSYMLNEYREKEITTERSVCESKMEKSSVNLPNGRSNSLSNCLNSGYLMNFRSKRDSKKEVKTENLRLNQIVRDAKKEEYRQNSEQVNLQANLNQQTPQSDTKRYQTLQNEQKNVLPLHHLNGLKTESKYSTPNLLFVGNMVENENENSRIKEKERSFEAFLGDIEADDDEYLRKHYNLGLLNI